MSDNKSLLLVLFFLIISFPYIHSQQAFLQQENAFCATTLVSPMNQIGGANVTSFGTLKALFIFIDFSDDNNDPNNTTWPVGTGPNYLNSIVDLTETQNSGIYANASTFF